MNLFQHIAFVPIVTMIASIATAIYAIIAYKTLFEMKKQRENIYRPELITVTTKFALMKYEQDIVGLKEHIKITKDTKRQEFLYYKIPLYNFGLGTAKDIKITFDFPYEKTVKMIKNLYQEANVKFEKKLEWEKDKNGTFVLITERCNFYTWIAEDNYDYLMPMSQEKSNGYVHIPPCIDYLLFTFCGAMIEVKRHDFQLFPELCLKVEYSDIASKKHSKKIKLKFNPIGITPEFVLGHISSIP